PRLQIQLRRARGLPSPLPRVARALPRIEHVLPPRPNGRRQRARHPHPHGTEGMTRTELDYAPLPPIHRRPIVRRVVVIAAILVLLPAFFWVSQTAYLRSRYLRYQQQCEDFSLPPGSVAYEENP